MQHDGEVQKFEKNKSKRSIDELKRKYPCRGCGKFGHWIRECREAAGNHQCDGAASMTVTGHAVNFSAVGFDESGSAPVMGYSFMAEGQDMPEGC